MLVDRGASFNALMYEDHQYLRNMFPFMRETPLHTAVALKRGDVIRYLIHKGASVDIEDCRGQTVMQSADEDTRRVIIQEIQNYGVLEWNQPIPVPRSPINPDPSEPIHKKYPYNDCRGVHPLLPVSLSLTSLSVNPPLPQFQLIVTLSWPVDWHVGRLWLSFSFHSIIYRHWLIPIVFHT
ncbi:uncharacterized protein N7518_000960 [Penicillium psychrosexuale]|uniref:uncharacterized protein n=1 Tax=Penicillium psychrosexuale TaxID=1002107 RepID=UPI002545ACD2|nr:uncharacterized protein N7518_000960 [Penicillium psychrosexuale]KAJ5804657.1 hypothetical protein N7518_000960 [Penicillium psychrosexuale]